MSKGYNTYEVQDEMTFGDKVRFAREYMGKITTTELAKRLNIEQGSVSKVENSKTRRFSQETTFRLSELSGLPLEFFMNPKIKSPDELTSDKNLADQLKKEIKFAKLNDAVEEEGLTEEEAIELIRTMGKIKRRV